MSSRALHSAVDGPVGERPLSTVAVEKGLVGGPFGSSLVGSDYVPEGIPVIRGGNMLDRFIGGEYAFVTPAKVQADLARNTAVAGDLVFTQRGTLGQVAVIPAGEFTEYVISQSQMRLRVDPSVADPRFVYYACRRPEFFKQISDNAISTGVPHINLGILARLTIPGLNLPSQRAIAEMLGALDDKIAANDRVVAVAEELGRAQFITGLRLGGESHTTTLGELATAGVLDLGDGYRTKRSEHGRTGFRIVRAGDVSDGRIDLTGPDFVAAEFERGIGRKVLTAGDVVLTTKGTVGRVAVVPAGVERATYSPQLCYFRAANLDRLDPGYLAGWFKSDDLQTQIATRMFKSDMAPYVNLQDVRSLVLPMPSIGLQRQIGQQQRGLQQLAHAHTHESRRLAATRDEFLPLLMSGRVRVKDSPDVGAEVL